MRIQGGNHCPKIRETEEDKQSQKVRKLLWEPVPGVGKPEL